MKTQIKPDPQFSEEEVKRLLNNNPGVLDTKFSVIFVTYNRCPSEDFMMNPLTWAFITLMNNSLGNVHEYLVVIDGSTDHTLENLEWLRKEFDLNIKVLHRNFRRGCSFSRREGIESVSNDTFFLVDDDCLYKKDFLLGAVVAYCKLQKELNGDLATLNLPMFEFQTDFIKSESINRIGKNDFSKAWFYHNFDLKPSEYSTKEDIYLDETKTILKPFEIETFKVPTVNSKRAFMNTGSFLDLSMWANDYSEHIEPSYRIKNSKYKMYHLPDPRVSCTHLKYGYMREDFNSSILDVRFNGVPFTLGEIMHMSNQSSIDTGCRVENEIFLSVKIGCFLSFYLKVSDEVATTFAVMEYDNFVEKNQNFATDQKVENMPEKERFELWHSAILKGIRVTEDQTGLSYSEFYKNLKTKLKF